MATRLRKVRKQRGSRTHGWGQIGQHRHSGSRGGTGMAGMHKHKWSFTVKYAPDHFGRNKFQPPNRTITKRWVNVGNLENLADDSSTLDLSSLGYDKLLGAGEVRRPIRVKVARASSNAVEKVKEAGGSVETELTQVQKAGDEKEIGKPSPSSKSESEKGRAKVS